MRLALLALLLAAPLASAREAAVGFGRTVAAVELAGAAGGQHELASLPLHPGAPLTRATLASCVRLLYQSGRYAQVAALVDAAGGGEVDVRFQVEPRQRILRIEFNGVQALSESVLTKAADLPPGTGFSPARVTKAAAAVALAYFRAGYRDAVVRWDASDAGRDVAIDLSVSEGDPTTLVRVELSGDLGLARPELRAAMALLPGDQLDLDQVDAGLEAIRALFRERGFYRARVLPATVAAADGQAVVEVRVEAGPHFRLQVRGAHTFAEATLLSQLHYQGQVPLDGTVEHELAERLRAFYELAGFPDAKVAVHESAPPPGADDLDAPPPPPPPTFDAPPDGLPPARGLRAHAHRIVTFLVRDGKPWEVHLREYPGLHFFKPADLDERIDPVLADAVPPLLTGGRTEALLEASFAGGDGVHQAKSPRTVVPAEVFASGPYRTALSQLQDLYKSQGFLDARLGPARLVEGAGDSATVVIPVHEGPRTLVSGVEVSGVRAMPPADVRALQTVHAGDPLSFAAIEQMRQAVAHLYQDRGYAFAEVEDDEEINEAGTRAKVVLHVTEGPLVRVSRIELKGLVHTDPRLVREALTLKVGDVLTPKAREQSVRNLIRLGIFTQASVAPADPDTVASQKPLVVEVREKPRFEAEVRGGASYADGPRASSDLSWSNLFGQNRTATLGLKVNWPVFRVCLIEEPEGCTATSLPVPLEWRFNAALVLPQFQGAGQSPVDLRFDAVYENLLRPSYSLSKVAALASLAGLLHRRLFGKVESNLLLEAEIEDDAFARRWPQFQAQLTLADQKALLLPEGRFFFGSVRPTLTLDARDDKLNPTSGWLFALGLDFSKSFYAVDPQDKPFDIELLRTDTQLSGYLPLNRRHRVVLALAGRLGRIFAPADSVVIGTKRLFLGGTQSLRGFDEDALVPEDVREATHAAIDRCRALVSGLGCDPQSQPATSQGGSASVLAKVELRFGLTESLDAGVFLDTGNLWYDAAKMDLTRLRYAVGAGIRYPLPIGPAALDVGVNLNRDDAYAEPLFHLHFAVGLF